MDATKALAVFCAAQVLALLAMSIWLGRPVFLLQPWLSGWDFNDFYVAAHDYLHSADPFLNPRFNKPPLSLWLGAPFLGLDLRAAALAFIPFNAAAIFGSIVLVSRALRFESLGPLSLITALFFPVYFLLDRGNVDGLVMLTIAVLAVAPNSLVGGIALWSAIALKFYPVILLGHLGAARRWGIVIATLIITVMSLAIWWQLWGGFIHSLIARAAFQLDEDNYSVIWLFIAALKPISGNAVVLGTMTGFMLYAFSLAAMIVVDLLWPPESARILLYIPFLIAVPLTVFPYAAVLLLLLIPVQAACKQTGWHSIIFVTGMMLVAFDAHTWTEPGQWLRLLPNTGILLLLIWSVGTQWQLRLNTQPFWLSGNSRLCYSSSPSSGKSQAAHNRPCSS